MKVGHRYFVIGVLVAVVTVSLYGITKQGQNGVRDTAAAGRQALRESQVAGCERGNGSRALTRVFDPDIGSLLLLLDCRASIAQKRAVPLSASDAALLMVKAHACVDVARRHGPQTPFCTSLFNGRTRGVPYDR